MLCSGTTSLEPARANSATHSHPSGSSRQSAGSSAPTTAATLAGPQGWRDLSGLVLSRGARWVSLPQLVLAHALVCGRGQLLAILREDEECGGAVEQLCAAAWALHAMPATTYSSQVGSVCALVHMHDGGAVLRLSYGWCQRDESWEAWRLCVSVSVVAFPR